MTLGPLMIDVAGTALTSEDREVLSHPLVGGVILFTRNFVNIEQLTELVRDVRAIRTPALLVAVDHEGGRVQRFRRDFTVLPPMRIIGHRYDVGHAEARELARQSGWLMAAELLAIGIDISFAPVVDLDYGASTVIGDRAFHRDARAAAELAIAFMHGMRDAGMAATAKHFPGHGAVVADSHVALPVDRRAYADLSDDLYPYRRLIDNGLPAVMMAHVVYEQVDSVPASFSRLWIQQELRTRLGFTGAVFSDDLTMQGASVIGDMPTRAQTALAAGCDMVPICNNRTDVLATLNALTALEVTDPVAQIRLARMRGQAISTRRDLLASAEWRRCEQAIAACMERPPLELRGL
ncbi:MAG: beta-N-acetylhexosaminidase [Candidatus Obscuribacterales bacterium]|nr:beta-N-acetylhexosaminidase [Steroidobacteraceae bacterium]